MIQLTRMGPVFSDRVDNLKTARANFQRQHYVILPLFIDASLLQLISRRLEQAEYQLQVYEGIGQDLHPNDALTTSLLNFLCNNCRLFETVEAITGCGRVGCFVGKVYRMIPGEDHYDSWHT